MSPSPRELLHRLFVYIEEQLKQVAPRGFPITKSGKHAGCSHTHNLRFLGPSDGPLRDVRGIR